METSDHEDYILSNLSPNENLLDADGGIDFSGNIAGNMLTSSESAVAEQKSLRLFCPISSDSWQEHAGGLLAIRGFAASGSDWVLSITTCVDQPHGLATMCDPTTNRAIQLANDFNEVVDPTVWDEPDAANWYPYVVLEWVNDDPIVEPVTLIHHGLHFTRYELW